MGGAILMNPWARPTPWLAIALTGCILTEQWPAEQETAAVRHVRLAAPLRVHLDGRQARAIVAKPEPS